MSGNTAIGFNRTAVSSDGDTLVIGIGNTNTTGNGNRGGDIRNSTFTGGAVGINTTGGNGKSGNYGLQIRGGMITSTLGGIDLQGTARDTTTGSGNFGMNLSRVPINALTGGVDLAGTGGGGVSNNYGASIQLPTLKGLDVMINGTARGTTAGANNRGLQLRNTDIDAESLVMDGIGGGGTNRNEALSIKGGEIVSDNHINLDGVANGNTTGSGNSGTIADRVTLQAVDEIIINGTGGGGKNANYGASLRGGRMESTGSFVIFDATADGSTFGSANIGLLVKGTEVIAGNGNSRMTGNGGGGINNNAGIQMKGGSFRSEDAELRIEANAAVATTGKRNIGGDFVGVDLLADDQVTVVSQGGSGTSNNTSFSFRNSALTSQTGQIFIVGAGSLSATGTKNHGIEFQRAEVSAATNVGFNGTSGTGTDRNYGVRIVGGTFSHGAGVGVIDIEGISRNGTTGKFNIGVSVTSRATFNGPELDIMGAGGGFGAGGAPSMNHGIFMDKSVVVNNTTSVFTGTAGAGGDSENEAGSFFP